MQEGWADFNFPAAGKPCKTWYKIIGDLASGKVPLLIVHGGPGLTHHYVLPIADVWERFGIPTIFYDQIGNGSSTRLPEKMGDEQFWTESLFHAELANLVSWLGLSSYDLLGHSWGGMMSANFAASHPAGLRKLVLANTAATAEAWDVAYRGYLEDLPQESQDSIRAHEAAQTTDSAVYQDILSGFNAEHFCRIQPMPALCQVSFDMRRQDPTVTMSMHGPDKWIVTGSLRGWTAIPLIKEIVCPTLLINGQSEGANDAAVQPFADQLAKVKWLKLQDSTHMPQWEERSNFAHVVGEWLQSD